MNAVIITNSGAKYRISKADGERCQQAMLGSGPVAQFFNVQDGRRLMLTIASIESVEVETPVSVSAMEAAR